MEVAIKSYACNFRILCASFRVQTRDHTWKLDVVYRCALEPTWQQLLQRDPLISNYAQESNRNSDDSDTYTMIASSKNELLMQVIRYKDWQYPRNIKELNNAKMRIEQQHRSPWIQSSSQSLTYIMTVECPIPSLPILTTSAQGVRNKSSYPCLVRILIVAEGKNF